MQGLDAGVSRDWAEGFMLVGERNDLVAARFEETRDLDRPMRFASKGGPGGVFDPLAERA